MKQGVNGKLHLKEIVSYSFGDMGCCLMYYMISYYLSFYCSVVLEIPLVVVGAIVFIVLCWDAFNDLGIGYSIDRLQSKSGKARPWIKWFMIPCCLSGILVFACPTDLSITARIIWIFAAYFIFVLFYTCINLPYSSLLSLMTDEDTDRTKLTTSRYVGAYIGTLIVTTSALPMVTVLNGYLGEGEGYTCVMSLFCVLALILFYLVYRNCHEINEGLEEPQVISRNNIKEALKSLFLNRSWLLTVLFSSIYWFRYPFYGTVMPYLYRFYFGVSESASSIMYTAGTLAGIVILPFIPRVVEKWDYKRTLVISCLISAAAMFGGFLCQKNLWLSVAFFTVNYAFESYPCALSLSMIADSLTYSELNFGQKVNGLGFAINSFCTKAAIGLGTLFSSTMLWFGGIDTSAGIGDVQSLAAITVIRVCFWLIPAALSLVMVFIVKQNPLNKETYKILLEKLNAIQGTNKIREGVEQ